MKKLLAADIGYCSTGMAIFAYDKDYCPEWRLFDSRCLHTSKGRETSVTLDDIRRTEFLALQLTNYFIENGCSAIVAELPSGGAQSASAQKSMALAVAMIATCRLFLQAPAVWVTPNESRKAAGWDKDAHPIPKGLNAYERKKALNARTKALKEFVIEAMVKKYPAIDKYIVADKEHVADACSAFEAKRDHEIIKELEK